MTAIAGFGTFFVAWYQLSKINSTDSNRFLLELRNAFDEERRWKIHCAIKNNDKDYLETHELDINDYLGLFEICSKMIDKGTISLNDFNNFYFYRLEHILQNELIVSMLLKNDIRYWLSFYRLLKQIPYLRKRYSTTKEQKALWDKIDNLKISIRFQKALKKYLLKILIHFRKKIKKF